jgi:hypothetical protein
MNKNINEVLLELDKYANDSNYFRREYRRFLNDEELKIINNELKYVENFDVYEEDYMIVYNMEKDREIIHREYNNFVNIYYSLEDNIIHLILIRSKYEMYHFATKALYDFIECYKDYVIKIEALLHLADWYKKFGFKEISSDELYVYMEKK